MRIVILSEAKDLNASLAMRSFFASLRMTMRFLSESVRPLFLQRTASPSRMGRIVV